jgi:hypothetical protein
MFGVGGTGPMTRVQLVVWWTSFLLVVAFVAYVLFRTFEA